MRIAAPKSELTHEPIVSTWPKSPKPAAYAGLLGDYVRAIEPRSEADPAAILLQTLVAFGNVIGRHAHFRVEQDYHFLNLFTIQVGPTSDGRKGTSLNHARRPFESEDKAWARASGMSSGEGLIHAVRDPGEQTRGLRNGKSAPRDSGVPDKRLMVEETEFGAVLRVMRRDGNILSTVLRQAWDDGNLRVLTKNSPVRATHAYISVIGHITLEELQRYLDETDLFNGFANRFLWACVRRSKYLPDGGLLDASWIVKFLAQFKRAVRFAHGVGRLSRSNRARDLWHEVYPKLSAGTLGLAGKVTSRAAPQVMRLACLYALLDRSRRVDRAHLESALALWDFCEASVRHIFGQHAGHPVADKVLRALRDGSAEGLTRTALFEDVLQSHHSREELTDALRVLLNAGLVRQTRERTKGRTAERWFASDLSGLNRLNRSAL